MKKDDGLTLIEVLASVVVLAVAIVIITMVLQQTSSSSRSNAVTDRSVQLTRTVLEEMKNNTQTNTINVLGQDLSIIPLRDNPPQALSFFYPNAGEQQYRLYVQSLDLQTPKVTLRGKEHDLTKSFRRIRVTCTNLVTNRSYELEALVEYK
jgi:prepilin-type N-terminal cleavage/methylation domain-containing protein